MANIIIDAKDAILGRVASLAAQKALAGEVVSIINAEKAVVTGSRENVLARYKMKHDRGDLIKGPFFPRMPDRIVRRAVRGMLPRKTAHGRDAYKRVMAYIGKPSEIKGEVIDIKNMKTTRLKNPKFVYVEEISKWLGAM